MQLRAAAVLAAALVWTALPATAAGGASALPSGRTEYRTPADYSAEIAALAAAHPRDVRRVVIGRSVNGRPIEGLEIARDVARRNDGRPVHLELGLTHAREWASGEVVMEFARELATSDAPRIAALRARTRTFVFPVVNPDGFALSRSGAVAQQRKNAHGVDLNRNFGAFWGGPGASDDPASDVFRGPGPFSEPESRALREWGSRHQVMVAGSLHSFGGTVLHQPGFRRTDQPGLPASATLPGTGRFAALGARMAAAAGYESKAAYELYDVTGAAEDWNYFNQFAYAYTIEIAGTGHQGPYRQMVVDQYDGLRDALALAGEAAASERDHALLRGTAPAGRTLRLTRTVRSPTSYVLSETESPSPQVGASRSLVERFRSTLRVPESGRFRWHVNSSTRPLAQLAGRKEAWTLRCGSERRRVIAGIGQVRVLALTCRG